MTSVLFIITSDPRTSHRPAEAIRIAAGVGTWQRVEITLYLRDAAVLALTESPASLIDEENYQRYFSAQSGFAQPLYVQSGNPLLERIGQTAVDFQEITDDQLAALAAQAAYVLAF